MLALVLVGALIAHSAVGAPSRCTEFCDEPVTSGATSGRTGNAYSSYSRYGSHSSWSSGSLANRNGLAGSGGRLESLDENGIAGGAVVGSGLDRPGTWEDKKHYVTDDGRGEMSYRAGQTVTNNGFSKFAQHSYRYGSHDNHQPRPDSQILTTAEFESEFQSMRQRINNFMNNFRLDAGSVVNANFLQDFQAKANLMTSQMNNVCNQVDVGSQMYQQMQQLMEQFRRDVEQRQREIESVVFQSTSSSSTSTNVNGEWGTYPSTQPAPAPVQYPTRPTVNMNVVVTQQIEQELNVVHNMVAKFATSFNHPENTPQYLSNLDAEINAINQKISELNSQTVQHQTLRARYEQLKTYFESCVTSIRARIEEIDRRNRELEERRLQREQELRLEAERKAEEHRLEQIRIQEENERIQREQQQQLIIQQQQWEQQQQQLQQQQLQQQQLQQQQLQQEQLRQQQLQQQLYPHTSGSSVQVSGSVEHTYTGSYGAQIHGTTGGSTGASSGFVQGSQAYPRPQPSTVPDVDIIAATNRLQQDLNRLQSEVNRFNSFSMRLTASNSASIMSEAESTAASLQNRINSLCETSNRYHNNEIYNHAEELRQRLMGYLQSFKSQAASYSAQYNAQYSQSGQFATSNGYQSSARYGSVQAPKVSNVEFEHSRSTEVEVTGRHLPADGRYNSNARLGRYARSVGEDYGPFFDSSQESLEYGQQRQPILDRDYTYGRVDEVDSYDKPYGYDLRNPNTPDNFEDYSQRTGPVELPREHQPVRAFRQGAARHQSQSLHQTHRIEDLTYQPGAVDDYYNSRQYPQDPSADSQWERENDSNQQHVSYGEAEDLENLDRPRSQKIDNTHGSVSDARNREIDQNRAENRRQQINRLNQRRTDGYENVNGKPRITGSYSKYEASQRTEEMTLEKSGFNYYSDDRTENPAMTNQHVQPITYDNSRLEQQTGEPLRVRPIAVHEKFEYAQKTENLTLEQSGFYDYRGSSENPKTAEYPQITTVASPGEVGSALEIEDLNLENSGLDDYSSQTRNKKLNDKPQRIQPPLASNFEINQQNEKHDLQQSGFGNLYAPNGKFETVDEAYLNQQTAGQINFGAESQIGRQFSSKVPLASNFEINQQNEKHDLQQSGFGSLYAPNGKFETVDEAYLNQQTTGQINFGAESQIGRQFSSHVTLKPGKLEIDSQQNLKPDIQNLELGHKMEHPVGQYIENLSQQREQSSLSVESSNLNGTYRKPKVDDQVAEISTTTRYMHHLLPTVRPTVRPAPKPIPRYTRPWQVSQINNVPKKLETEEKQFERDNTKIEESVNLQNLDKHSESLRGDLPGVSETSTVPVPITTEKLDINQQVNSEYDSRQKFEQVNLNANSQLDDLQKSRNDWAQNNNEDSQFGQTNYFNQQSIQHNYEHSQQSIHYNQQNNGQVLNPSNYQPLHKQNKNGQQELLPDELENDQLRTSIQEDFRQQVQTPLQQQQPGRFEQDITQREEEELAERVIPLEETKTINDLSEPETTTAPPSFWKRVGHKLSNSFDKAKEKARNIFG